MAGHFGKIWDKGELIYGGIRATEIRRARTQNKEAGAPTRKERATGKIAPLDTFGSDIARNRGKRRKQVTNTGHEFGEFSSRGENENADAARTGREKFFFPVFGGDVIDSREIDGRKGSTLGDVVVAAWSWMTTRLSMAATVMAYVAVATTMTTTTSFAANSQQRRADAKMVR